jgi:hypothetical protein
VPHALWAGVGCVEATSEGRVRLCSGKIPLPEITVCLENWGLTNVFFAATPENSQGLASATKFTRIANSLRESGMSQSDIDRYVEGIDVNAQQRSTSGDARATAR